jgi:hypothetical protein
LKFETPPSDSIRNSPNRSPKFGGGSNSGDNSDEQLLSIRASSMESEGTTAFVSSRASFRCLRFVDLTNGSSQIDDFVLGSDEGHLLWRASTIVVLRVSSCSSFSHPCRASPSLLYHPQAASPLPPLILPWRGPLPSPALDDPAGSARACPAPAMAGSALPPAQPHPIPRPLPWLRGRSSDEE